MLDRSTPLGRRAASRLEQDQIVWFVTVDGRGTPQPRPVWFLWDEGTVLIYSRPGTAKLAHLRRNPKVALHFNGDREGGDIVVLTGEAAIEVRPPERRVQETYLAKYQQGLRRIGMTSEGFTQEYSVLIRVRPTSMRGHE